jgi:pimeloyl-ACP methyl ester carboxylesterase
MVTRPKQEKFPSGRWRLRLLCSVRESVQRDTQGPNYGRQHHHAKDSTVIYYKDWGPKSAQPIVFHHGWPLSADDWDGQMLYFLERGFRVIAHDRRGHGRSSQTETGNEMDTYAADVAALTSHLDLKRAIHIGHSIGGGEVARYVAQYGQGWPRRQGRADRRCAADHGQIRRESRRFAD